MRIELKKPRINHEEEYFYKLTNQFKEATGLNKELSRIELEEEYENCIKEEFENWIQERRRIAEIYLTQLDSAEVEYNHKMTAEIGKGLYDSAVDKLDTTIITPYTDGLTNPRTIGARLVITPDDNSRLSTPIPKINSIMTQNPYSDLEIKNWEKLFNEEILRVTLGIYGNINDKDRYTKIKQLKEFKKRLTVDYKEVRYTFDNSYGYAITSSPSIKKRTKTKSITIPSQREISDVLTIKYRSK